MLHRHDTDADAKFRHHTWRRFRVYRVQTLMQLFNYLLDSTLIVYLGLYVDNFDNFCLRRILLIPYTAHVTNADVRLRAGSPPQLLLPLIQTRRLRFFGHVARMSNSQDTFRAIHTSTRSLPKDWRRRPGRPRHTWLRTINADLHPLNHGLNSAW